MKCKNESCTEQAPRKRLYCLKPECQAMARKAKRDWGKGKLYPGTRYT